MLSQQAECPGLDGLSPRWTWRASLPYLNPNATLTELPPRPSLHEGLQARLTMTRTPEGADVREVLRAYKTDLAAADGESYKPLYLVSLTREVKSDGFIFMRCLRCRRHGADIAGLRTFWPRPRALQSLPSATRRRCSGPRHRKALNSFHRLPRGEDAGRRMTTSKNIAVRPRALFGKVTLVRSLSWRWHSCCALRGVWLKQLSLLAGMA